MFLSCDACHSCCDWTAVKSIHIYVRKLLPESLWACSLMKCLFVLSFLSLSCLLVTDEQPQLWPRGGNMRKRSRRRRRSGWSAKHWGREQQPSASQHISESIVYLSIDHWYWRKWEDVLHWFCCMSRFSQTLIFQCVALIQWDNAVLWLKHYVSILPGYFIHIKLSKCQFQTIGYKMIIINNNNHHFCVVMRFGQKGKGDNFCCFNSFSQKPNSKMKRKIQAFLLLWDF